MFCTDSGRRAGDIIYLHLPAAITEMDGRLSPQPAGLGHTRRSSSMLITASRLLVCRVRVELRVAEFDLAAAVQ